MPRYILLFPYRPPSNYCFEEPKKELPDPDAKKNATPVSESSPSSSILTMKYPNRRIQKSCFQSILSNYFKKQTTLTRMSNRLSNEVPNDNREIETYYPIIADFLYRNNLNSTLWKFMNEIFPILKHDLFFRYVLNKLQTCQSRRSDTFFLNASDIEKILTALQIHPEVAINYDSLINHLEQHSDSLIRILFSIYHYQTETLSHRIHVYQRSEEQVADVIQRIKPKLNCLSYLYNNKRKKIADYKKSVIQLNDLMKTVESNVLRLQQSLGTYLIRKSNKKMETNEHLNVTLDSLIVPQNHKFSSELETDVIDFEIPFVETRKNEDIMVFKVPKGSTSSTEGQDLTACSVSISNTHLEIVNDGRDYQTIEEKFSLMERLCQENVSLKTQLKNLTKELNDIKSSTPVNNESKSITHSVPCNTDPCIMPIMQYNTLLNNYNNELEQQTSILSKNLEEFNNQKSLDNTQIKPTVSCNTDLPQSSSQNLLIQNKVIEENYELRIYIYELENRILNLTKMITDLKQSQIDNIVTRLPLVPQVARQALLQQSNHTIQPNKKTICSHLDISKLILSRMKEETQEARKKYSLYQNKIT